MKQEIDRRLESGAITAGVLAAILALVAACAGGGEPRAAALAAAPARTATAAPPPGGAEANADPIATCGRLITLSLPDTDITSARVVAAAGDVPEYCKAEGAIEKVILFEIALPTTAWNGKFFYAGGGGYNGTVPVLTHALARGYAAAGSDTGHRGDHWDASALLNNPQAQVNYAHRATHLVTVLAKKVVQAYYGRAERHAVFMGCSNGGKMGLMEVQRYPEDFEGVVIGGFVIERTGLMTMFNWTEQALLDAPIPPYKIAAMEKATLAACDAQDGLADGVVDRPDKCRFDPKTVACPGSTDGAERTDCLTPGQVKAWEKILGGPTNSRGQRLYPGYSPGHEGDYPAYITGLGTLHGYPSSNWMYMDNFMRWVVFGPAFDSMRQFDFDRSPAAVARFAKDQDAADTDFSKFKAHGGKLIMYNGWADHSTPPLRSIEYYGELRKTHGAATDDFVRLFMVPGLHHCTGGPGPNTFGGRGQRWVKNDPDNDIMAAIDRWVERGVAPEKLVATKFKNDDPAQGIARTRPLCPYPQVARYRGSGSIDEAASFVCAAPQ